MSILSAGIVNDLPIVESWERTNALDDYRGDKTNMSIVSTPLLDGARALAFQTSGAAKDENVVLYDGSELHVQTDQTYQYGTRMTEVDDLSSWLVFFADSANTGASDLDSYVLSLDWNSANQLLEIGEVTGGTYSTLQSTSVTISANTWYEPKFSVDTSTSPNTIKAELVDDSGTQTVSAQDDSNTSGDHGFGGDDRRYGDEDIYHDFLRIVSEDPLP